MIQPLKNKRRLLFLINAAITGGAERHTAQLARALPSYGFTTTVFAIKRGTEYPAKVDLREPQSDESLWQRTQILARFLKQNAVDVIVPINQRPLAVAFAARALSRGREPIVPIFHTTLLRNRKEQLMQRVYTPLFNRSDGVIFISDNQRRHWERDGIRNPNAVTILNGINIARYSPAALAESRAPTRQELRLSEGDLVLGCVAVLRAEKNHLQLVDAVARLRGEGIPARALIVGDGPLRNSIEARARDLNIVQHIIMTGMQRDVRPYLAALDIGVLCSTSIETLSLSALEVMAAGKPMIMSNIGGASEIVDGQNGETFPVGNTDALVAAIKRFAPPADRSAGVAAHATVISKFNEQLMFQRYASVLGPLQAVTN